MTKEQAIEVLHELDGSLYETQQVALDLAIKVLEQQPSDDCVSRQAVKDIIHEYKNNIDSQLSWLSDGVCDLPPVTPTQSWIPISERLPRQEVEVLTCNEHGFIEIQSLEDGYWENQHGDCTDFADNNVIAWQPLPKPYEDKRGGKNEDN